MAQSNDTKEVGDIAVTEARTGKVPRTRSAMEVPRSEDSSKRTKLASDSIDRTNENSRENSVSPATSEASDQLVSHRYDENSQENSVSPVTPDSEASDLVPASQCSSNHSLDFAKHDLRSVDPKVESESHAKDFDTEVSTLTKCRCGETTQSSDLKSSPAMKPSKPSLHQKHPALKMPEKELDELFSALEKYEQKRFLDKYNYDIVNDVPLEGRYEWVRLKP
ncbi:hypothetical protein U1Q18_034997 [Sarracenia purpurea var. burkii]